MKHQAETKADKAKHKAAKVVGDAKSTAEEYKERGERAVEEAIEGAKHGFKK